MKVTFCRGWKLSLKTRIIRRFCRQQCNDDVILQTSLKLNGLTPDSRYELTVNIANRKVLLWRSAMVTWKNGKWIMSLAMYCVFWWHFATQLSMTKKLLMTTTAGPGSGTMLMTDADDWWLMLMTTTAGLGSGTIAEVYVFPKQRSQRQIYKVCIAQQQWIL